MWSYVDVPSHSHNPTESANASMSSSSQKRSESCLTSYVFGVLFIILLYFYAKQESQVRCHNSSYIR